MDYPFKKILIIQTAFLGDVVLATGIVKKLKTSYPEAQIDFLLKKGNESVLADHPLVRKVMVFDKKQKIKNLISLIRTIRSEKYDMVVNLHRFGSSGLITILSGATIKTGFDKNPFSFGYDYKHAHIIDPNIGIHEIERNHSTIKRFTDESPERPYLAISKELESKVAHFKNSPYITIAPGSVWFTKQYPEEKWGDFIQKIPATLKIYLLGGPQEFELCERIKAKNRNSVNLAGQLRLLESAALMKDAAMNYVNDSGPMHLASALNAPISAIYCSTVPGFGFGPLSDKSTIIQTLDRLKCRPCGLHGHKNCPEGHFLCANRIETEQLLQILGQKV